MDAFNEDVLVEIFSHLEPNDVLRRCALVCRFWNEASKEQLLWERQASALVDREVFEEYLSKCGDPRMAYSLIGKFLLIKDCYYSFF